MKTPPYLLAIFLPVVVVLAFTLGYALKCNVSHPSWLGEEAFSGGYDLAKIKR